MSVEAKDLSIPDRLTFYPENWKVVDVLEAKIHLHLNWHQVAIVMPKEPGIQAGMTTGFKMMLAAVTDEGKITTKAADVMTLEHLGDLGFVTDGIGFTTIFLDRENPSKDYPKQSKQINSLVSKVNQHRDILISNTNQEDLEKAAVDIAPVLVKFFK
jgi:hypothetical protein